MDRRQAEIVSLLSQHPSKEHIEKFAQRIKLDPGLISLTIELDRSNSGRLANLASWALRKVFDADQMFSASYF